MTPKLTTGLIAVSVAAMLAFAGAVSTAEAGRGGGHGGDGRGGGGHGGGHHGGGHHMSGSAFKGGSSIGKFHSNQGGKYAYGRSGGKFHTNQGGKYRGSSGKFDNHHHHGKYGHYRRYGYPWYGLPLYSYSGGGCSWLYSRAVATGSDYWWDRYYQCTGSYY
jgi:hypothetical protein